jgi:argininosuccinate lyase
MILFTSQEFGFLELADAYCTGSSIMPQKKNPDVPELVRGKAAVVIGEVVKLLALMKALPLGYNKDAQEDKKAWFSALDTTTECVAIMTDLVETMRPIPGKMREATRRGHILATEYANYLVRKGLSFREAHHVVGALVREAEQRGVDLSELPLAALQQGSSLFGDDIRSVTVERAASSKNSIGAPGDAALPALLDELSLLLAKG